MYVDTKKAGLTLLLFRYLRLWYCLNIRTATPKPTPICTYARVPILNRYERYGYTYPEDIKCCNVLDVCEFTRFQVAKHKAFLTPLLCLVIAHPLRVDFYISTIIPCVDFITATKVQKYFKTSKILLQNL